MTIKRPKKKITIRSRNLFLLQVLHKQISEFETIIKVYGDSPRFPDPYVHLGLVKEEGKWVPHLTNERESDPAHRHQFLSPVSSEESIRLFLLLFSAPNSPPPRVSSIENKEEMEEAWRWLKARVSKAIHPPQHKMIRIFKQGPVRDIVVGLLNGNPDAIDIDMEEAKQLKYTGINDPENFELRFEDDFEPMGLELGFLKHPQRAVFLSPGKPVVELRMDTVWAWIEELLKMPGVQELLKELERKGILKSKG
jgi:hypothetical protein